MKRYFLFAVLVFLISASALPLLSQQLPFGQSGVDHRTFEISGDAKPLAAETPDTFLPIVLGGGVTGATATPTGTPTSTPTSTPTPTPTTPGGTATPTPTPTATSNAVVFVSDDFNRADADRCALGLTSGYAGGNNAYYLPLWPGPGPDPANPVGADIVDQTLHHNGLGMGGVMLTNQAGACDNTTVRGIDLGQNLYVAVDIKVPTDANNRITQAGPFFRGRAAARGDELIGGLNTGYWAILDSTGYVHVIDLADGASILNFTLSKFDPNRFYQVEFVINSTLIKVKVHGPVDLPGGRAANYQEQTASVRVDGVLDGISGNLFSDGTVGINFGGGPNQGEIGGQQADNLIVGEYRTLD